MASPVVAVIDIGSNSIKSLAANRGTGGELAVLKTGTIEARISAGIARARPELGDEGMQRGIAAIQALLAELLPFSPSRTILVATSAVRDAVNGAEFRRRVHDATGHELRVLSGGEEADLIGRGLLSDPVLAGLQDFYAFDLGGGSLECLAFRARRAVQSVSLPLGCVRLMERCVANPAGPFSDNDRQRVTAVCREALAKGSFHFDLPATSTAFFTGGTVTTARAIFAARARRPIADTAEIITVEMLRTLLDDTARLDLDARRGIRGLPPARADVFPTALATVIAVAEAGGIPAFRHSFRNLRYGVAAEALGL